MKHDKIIDEVNITKLKVKDTLRKFYILLELFLELCIELPVDRHLGIENKM